MKDERGNENIRQALKLARSLCALADRGEIECRDESCAVLFGVVRDCGHAIRRRAEKERDEHAAHGRWDDASGGGKKNGKERGA